MTTIDKLVKAQTVEELAARMYTELATRQPEGSKGREVFRRLAAEEQQHALRIAMLASQYKKSPTSFGELPLDATELDSMVSEMTTLLDKLGRAGGETSFESALQFAMAVEKRFAALHAECLAVGANPDFVRVFEGLARSDAEHAAVLKRLVPADGR